MLLCSLVCGYQHICGACYLYH